MTIPKGVAPVNHGGDLGAARKLFPNAPQPFIDLSAGINPHPYPVPEFRDGLYARLPEQASLLELKEIAAKAYGTPSPEHVAIAPGSQILVAQVGFLLARGRACVLTPIILMGGSSPRTCCLGWPIACGGAAVYSWSTRRSWMSGRKA